MVTGGHCGPSWALNAQVGVVGTGGHWGHRWALWSQLGIVGTEIGHA